MGKYFIGVQPSGLEENRELKTLIGKLKRTQSDRGQETRWTAPSLWHVTLFFLGEVSVEHLPEIISALTAWNPKPLPLELRVQGVGAFPEPGHARVLFLGIQEDREFLELRADLARHLEALGFKDEERGFVPHLTLARFRNAIGVGDLVKLGGRKRFGDYAIGKITLFESALEGPNLKYIPKFEKPL